jgi:hypothetical protein
MRPPAVLFVTFLVLTLSAPGCSGDASGPRADSGKPGARGENGSDRSRPEPGGNVKRSELGRHVWLETEGDRRRVRVEASVCLRQGVYGLECLLCRKGTKEHESILVTTADAQVIHTALVAAGAEPGLPARFDQRFEPPSGSRIKVVLEYEDQGKLVSVPAGRWVRDIQSRKELTSDWVFAGSLLWPNPDGDDKPKVYAANTDGAYVCVINVPTAMLDLTLHTPSAPESRAFQPFTEHIPAEGTAVMVIFEPVAGKNAVRATGKN